jgi:hypothetical protein
MQCQVQCQVQVVLLALHMCPLQWHLSQSQPAPQWVPSHFVAASLRDRRSSVMLQPLSHSSNCGPALQQPRSHVWTTPADSLTPSSKCISQSVTPTCGEHQGHHTGIYSSSFMVHCPPGTSRHESEPTLSAARLCLRARISPHGDATVDASVPTPDRDGGRCGCRQAATRRRCRRRRRSCRQDAPPWRGRRRTAASGRKPR